MSFEYDIALSFAGEQRTQVERVARCLQSSSVSVFFDSDEKATLWGKDLYLHLSDIYKNKARYCIVFASVDYARKLWPNHELRSAQARAFEEKGTDYILPVRFDSTEIPGILPTVGYLDFHSEGPEGICAAALIKLGKSRGSGSTTPSRPLSCEFSSRAFLLSTELQLMAFPTIEQGSWGTKIELTVAAESAEIDSLFSKFRGHSKVVAVGYGFDVALAKLTSAVRSSIRGESHWHLELTPTQTEFSNDCEMGTESTTADQFAERRVRRLLLNESPWNGQSGGQDPIAIANEAMEESLVRGLNSYHQIERSNFPTLYKDFGQEPEAFLEIAWISTVSNLKLSAAVQHIDHLKLTLSEGVLDVQFLGRRHRKYVNVDPYQIEVSGRIAIDGK